MSDPYETPKSSVQVAEDTGLRLASRWKRFFGAILDALISGGSAALVGYFLGVYSHMGEDGSLPLNDMILAFLIGIGVFLILNGHLLYTRGQTIGKALLGTVVVDLDGVQVSGNVYLLKRLLPIWLVTQIPIFGAIVGLVDALLIYREDKNCLHDDIAKTRVIEKA